MTGPRLGTPTDDYQPHMAPALCREMMIPAAPGPTPTPSAVPHRATFHEDPRHSPIRLGVRHPAVDPLLLRALEAAVLEVVPSIAN